MTMAGLIVILAAAGVVMNYVLSNLSFFKKMTDGASLLATGGFFDPFANATGGMVFNVLLVIMVSSLVTKVYQSGAAKQLVSCGISRNNVILGQFLAFTVVFSCVALVNALSGGIANVVQKGFFGLTDGNYGRMVLSMVGSVLVVANLCSLYLLIAHLTGSMGAAIAVGLVFLMGLPYAVFTAAQLLKIPELDTYFITTVQTTATMTSIPLKDQLIAMAVLCGYTVVLLLLTQLVFKKKEIK